ncbi:hypothetical protein KDA_26840 [Dictyobacter alpinus]|uniref:histidine kinase n=1 Tax=Dictyobacter alpinus TaxID=2014873 RepID=A0A402B7B9_9CHLR|nr:LuxR C-terminal-related transcriptional regulator [Dictyobacter alpinus]GCE27200.1 hypothetical protein KDA_26840 [Dictyobacter alpinus]
MLPGIDVPDMQIIQEDQRRLARELHDNVIQSLTVLVTDLEHFRSCQSIEQDLDGNVANWHTLALTSLLTLRQTSGGLCKTKTTTHDFDFMAAVLTLLKSMQDAGYTVTFECHDWPSPLSGAYATNLYDVLREAILNICQHAAAASIVVSLSRGEECLHMRVSDDGMSTVFASVGLAQGWHQSLNGLRERVALLGGQVSIARISAQGTHLHVDMPVPVRISALLTYPVSDLQATEPVPPQDDGLTPRERELVILIARGFVVKEIARLLKVSEKTVRNHISNVYHKLSIYDRSQLVIYAMKKGLVNLQSL